MGVIRWLLPWWVAQAGEDKRGVRLKLSRKETTDLGIGKNRTIFTYVYISNVASSTFTYTAFHSHLQGGYYLIMGKPQFF